MKNLQVKSRVLIIVYFLMLAFFSCNNEELFVVKESTLLIEEVDETEQTEETEDDSNNEDNEETTPINAVDDSFSTFEDVSIDVELYLNDESLPSAFTVTNTDPINGVLTIDNNETPSNFIDDSIIYTPNPGFFGIDSFEYTICDAVANSDNCDTAIVTITIEAAADIPPDTFENELKAFPSAYGAGAYVTGGRGGQVIHVTNLNDSGVGSLRDAMSKTYPRIIVFDVSGEINIGNTLGFGSGNVTIAGQTAPEGGITLIGNRIYDSGEDNIIIRYIRFRNGIGSNNGDCLTIASNNGLIVDHCSFAWSKDEAIDLESSYNNDGSQTIQNCLFYENKTAMLVGTDNIGTDAYGEISILRNVVSNTSHRFPKTNGSVEIDVINNLIHNWRYRTLRLDASRSTENFKLNLEGNYFQSGNNTVGSAGNTGAGIHKISTGNGSSTPQIWSRNNYLSPDIISYYNLSSYNENTDESSAWSNFPSSATEPVESSWFVNSRLPLKGAAPTILANTSLKSELLSNVGASSYLNADGTVGIYRDEHDIEAVALVKDNGSSTRFNENLWDDSDRLTAFNNTSTPLSNTRPAGYDTDQDGMPDIWETAKFGDLSKDGTGDSDGDGYTDLEEYLNAVDN